MHSIYNNQAAASFYHYPIALKITGSKSLQLKGESAQMRILTIAALVLFSGLTAKAQYTSSIKWDERKTLQWTDFNGRIADDSKFDAECFAEVCYNYTFYNLKNFKFDVYANFDKSTSWSRKEKQSGELLKHEQLHFDIAHLYALKLKHEFENFHYTKNYEEEIAEIFDNVKQEYQLVQRQYDDETKHALNKQQQKAWEDYVVTELKNTTSKLQLAKTNTKPF